MHQTARGGMNVEILSVEDIQLIVLTITLIALLNLFQYTEMYAEKIKELEADCRQVCQECQQKSVPYTPFFNNLTTPEPEYKIEYRDNSSVVKCDNRSRICYYYEVVE